MRRIVGRAGIRGVAGAGAAAGLAVFGAAAGVPSGVTPASTSTTVVAPYASASHQADCYADNGTCEASAKATAGTGVVNVSTSASAPSGGSAAGNAFGTATGTVRATYALTDTAYSLTVHVVFDVSSASAGHTGTTASPKSVAQLSASAGAADDACAGSGCRASSSRLVLSESGSSQMSVSKDTVAVDVLLADQAGGPLPTGTIELSAGLASESLLGVGDTGTEASAGKATVQSITVTESASQPVDPVMLSSDRSESVYGQPVTFTATLSPIQPGLPVPTGNVDFFDGWTLLGSAPLTGGNISRCALTVSGLSGGSHTVTAVYEGDSTWAQSTSPPVTVVVDRVPTALQAAPVPFASLATGPSLSATLTSGGAGVAGRTVSFTVGTTTACRAVTDAQGVARCTAPPTVTPALVQAGGYGAAFAGDVDYLPSSASGSVAGP